MHGSSFILFFGGLPLAKPKPNNIKWMPLHGIGPSSPIIFTQDTSHIGLQAQWKLQATLNDIGPQIPRELETCTVQYWAPPTQ